MNKSELEQNIVKALENNPFAASQLWKMVNRNPAIWRFSMMA